MFWLPTKKLFSSVSCLVGRFVIFKLIFKMGVAHPSCDKDCNEELQGDGDAAGEKGRCAVIVVKKVVEHALDCHIIFETVVKTGLLVLDFVSL